VFCCIPTLQATLFHNCFLYHPYLHSFPTRRSSDLPSLGWSTGSWVANADNPDPPDPVPGPGSAMPVSRLHSPPGPESESADSRFGGKTPEPTVEHARPALRGVEGSFQRSRSPRMNASTASWAPSSSFCSGGDFMK